MDSFQNHGLDESAFGDKGLSGLKTFDAFREYPTWRPALQRKFSQPAAPARYSTQTNRSH
jgi:hypothetical protein